MLKKGFIITLFFIAIHNLNGQIINIEDKRVALGDSIKFKGFEDLGVNFYRNDKQLMTVKANMQLEYVNRKHFVLLLNGFN